MLACTNGKHGMPCEWVLKAQGEAILRELGLNTTTAITLFFMQIVKRRSFPLELKIPSTETIASFDEAKKSSNDSTSYESVNEAFDDVWDKE